MCVFGLTDLTMRVLNVLRGGGVTRVGQSPKEYHFFGSFPYIEQSHHTFKQVQVSRKRCIEGRRRAPAGRVLEESAQFFEESSPTGVFTFPQQHTLWPFLCRLNSNAHSISVDWWGGHMGVENIYIHIYPPV